MSKHTPGPWKIWQQPGENVYIDSESNGSVGKIANKPGRPELVQANAHLIAAAPEMLAALEQLICPDCEHTLERHIDKYGCEFERGDRQVQEVGAVAMGPCGCKAIMLSDDLKNRLAAIRKVKGDDL